MQIMSFGSMLREVIKGRDRNKFPWKWLNKKIIIISYQLKTQKNNRKSDRL